jgi:hypothetical protein
MSSRIIFQLYIRVEMLTYSRYNSLHRSSKGHEAFQCRSQEYAAYIEKLTPPH